MDMAVMVDTLNRKGCKFLLTRNFQNLNATQEAVQAHHRAVAEGNQRKLILMAIQHDVLPDYTILVCTDYPNPHEVERFGFHPVRKDRTGWIPVQYRNRMAKEHKQNRHGDYEHTTNYNYISALDVKEYLDMAAKREQIKLIYK